MILKEKQRYLFAAQVLKVRSQLLHHEEIKQGTECKQCKTATQSSFAQNCTAVR